MKRLSIVCLLLLLAVPLLGARADFSAPPMPQQGPPPLPANFSGTVRVSGANAPAGAYISAWVNGHQGARDVVRFDALEGSVYVLNVSGDDPMTPQIDGGTPGAEITFILELQGGGNVMLWPRVVWVSGAINMLDLSYTPRVVLPFVIAQGG